MLLRWLSALKRTAAYRWYDARRGVVAFVAIVVLTAAGFGVVENLADNAGDAADDAHDAADVADATAQLAEGTAELAEATAEKNRKLACGLADLISYVPALQFEGEPVSNFVGWIIARRSILIDIRDDNTCSPEVQDVLAERVRKDERVLERLGVDPSDEGGDAAGSDPGGGGGPPGGQGPPADQGVLDPIIDPVAPEADCDLTVDVPQSEDVILCTEPDS